MREIKRKPTTMTINRKFILVMAVAVVFILAGCTNQKAPSPAPQPPQDTQEVMPDAELSDISLDSSTGPENANALVFQNVNLITMVNDQVLENQSVVVEDGLIIAIGDANSISIPENARIIPGEGHYLMPGLFDMHVHWWRYTGEETLYLANGVTSVMNMWGSPEILRLQASIEAGSHLAPRLFSTGPIFDGPEPIWPESQVLSTPEEAREAVIQVKEQGYNAVKIYEMLTLEVYQAIMDTAKEIDIKVVGHVPRQVGLQQAAAQGQHTIEHLGGFNLENLDQETQLLADHNVWSTPTLAIVNVMKAEGEIDGLEFIPPRTLNLWRNRKDSGVWTYDLSIRQRIVRNLHEKGGRIMAGTDANNPYVVPGFSLHNELTYLAEAGLSPYQVLQTATTNPAEFLGQQGKLGTLEVGKEADVILLTHNPLEDITNTRTIAGTMSRGRWLPQDWIEEELEKVRYKY